VELAQEDKIDEVLAVIEHRHSPRGSGPDPPMGPVDPAVGTRKQVPF
jgi:hypothetical protein